MKSNEAGMPTKFRRYLLFAAVCLVLALVFSPGVTRELLRVTPSDIQDHADWTRVDARTAPDVSLDGKTVRLDEATFQFNGEKYAIPLSANLKIPPVYSVSFWARVAADGGGTPFLAIETEKGNPFLLMFAQSGGGNTKFMCAAADHFGNVTGLASRPKQIFKTGEWVHMAFVVNYKFGIQTLYINGGKQNSISMSAGTAPPLVPRRLWVGSTPDNATILPCEIQDIRILEGGVRWWQIRMYMVLNRYFLSFFRIPLQVVFLLFSAGSVVFFAMASYAAAKRNAPACNPPVGQAGPSKLASVHNGLFLLFAVAGFLFVVAAFYPGAMSSDSIEQYQQGRNWKFSDWHPPFMAALLGIFDRIFHSPAPLMIIHGFLYWLAFYLLARAFLRVNVLVAYLFSLLGFWPAFLTWTGVLWKDVGTTTGFLLAAAVLCHYSLQGRRPPWTGAILVLIALLYGVLVRSYSSIAYVPLVFWLAFLLSANPSSKRRGLRFALLGLVGVALVPAANAVVNLVLNPTPQCPLQSVLYHDLVGISVLSGERCLLHPYHRPQFQCSEVKALYTPVCHDTVTFNSRGLLIRVTEIKPLFRDWLNAVFAHPQAYLKHRWNVFAILFSLNDRPSWNHFRMIEDNTLGFKSQSGETGRQFDSYIKSSPPWVFFGYIYLVFALYEIVYLAVVLRIRRSLFNLMPTEIPIFFLAVSSLCYLLPYFFLVPSRDFRYLYWGTVASTLGLVLMLYVLLCAGWSRKPATAGAAIRRPRP